MFELKRVEKGEEKRAFEFINDAKKYLKENGVNQWQNGYPNISTIERDAELERGYFIIKDGEEIGYVCIDFGGEPGYEKIDGKWKSSGKYSVIHRMTIKNTFRNSGIAFEVFRLAEELTLKNKIYSVKVDTDNSNKKMQHIISKSGYEYCGIIISEDGGERLAYEKTLKKS